MPLLPLRSSASSYSYGTFDYDACQFFPYTSPIHIKRNDAFFIGNTVSVFSRLHHCITRRNSTNIDSGILEPALFNWLI
jgi:hypothetical protein